MYNLENEVKLPSAVANENRWLPLCILKALTVVFSVKTTGKIHQYKKGALWYVLLKSKILSVFLDF